MNRTLQGRLVNELRVAGIRTVEVANRYLRDRYVPQHNATFRRPPLDPANAFVPVGAVELGTILCQQDERVVAPDNTVTGLGRWPKPEVQFASLFPKRTGHVSNS